MYNRPTAESINLKNGRIEEIFDIIYFYYDKIKHSDSYIAGAEDWTEI